MAAQNIAQYALTAHIEDVSSATANLSDAAVVVPFAGTLTQIDTVIQGATLSVAAAVLDFTVSGTGVAAGDITIASGAVAGEKDQAILRQVVVVGDVLAHASAGASTGVTNCHITYIIDRSD